MTDNYKKKIDYQFVPGPINLMWALDSDCWKAICILIDKENYWKSRSKVFNGYFTLSVEELAEHLRLKNKKDARLTLEALYRAGLIDVKAESGKRMGAKIKINWEVINGEDIDWVEKLPRDAKITYCEDTKRLAESTNCTPTLEKEIEIEKDTDIELDKEIDLKTEQVEKETIIPEGDIEIPEERTFLTFDERLQSFIDNYPYINYSYPPEVFNSTYSQELADFQNKVREDTGMVFPINDLSVCIHSYKTTGKYPS